MNRVLQPLPTIALGLILVFLSFGLAKANEDTVTFVSVIQDLPLMPGLREAPDDGLVFDTMAGRIVEAVAFGKVSRTDVLSFYGNTLPQLGWTYEKPTRFLREGEVLKLEFSDMEKPDKKSASILMVRFSLSPFPEK